MNPLAKTVLPMIRTRADVWRWEVAHRHGGRMHDAIDLIVAAMPSADPAEVFDAIDLGISSAVQVIARADDSSGTIGGACERLLQLHPGAAVAARVAPVDLIDWMITFQFAGEVDYFRIDPVAYAPALGELGMRKYRSHLNRIADGLGPRPDEFVLEENWAAWSTLDWNAQRLAVYDRDAGEIIRIHQDPHNPAWGMHQTARAFAEIEDWDAAIEWARAGAESSADLSAFQSAVWWAELIADHRPSELQAVRHQIFECWPNAATATDLYQTVGTQEWPQWRDTVLGALEATPREAVQFALQGLQDCDLAWELAHRLDLTDAGTWSEVVQAYEQVDSLATVPIHRLLVEDALEVTDVRRYRPAARRLARMLSITEGTSAHDDVIELIGGLRQTYRRRRRLIEEFDGAGLP